MNLYAAHPLANFWVRVLAGEGQLAGVSVRPFPVPAGENPTITDGHYQYAYGQPTEVKGRDLTIEADVLHVGPSPRASITAELWETVPARFAPGSGADPEEKIHLMTFEATGTFGADNEAHLSIVIKIV